MEKQVECEFFFFFFAFATWISVWKKWRYQTSENTVTRKEQEDVVDFIVFGGEAFRYLAATDRFFFFPPHKFL